MKVVRNRLVEDSLRFSRGQTELLANFLRRLAPSSPVAAH
jgi:hypothetical protein